MRKRERERVREKAREREREKLLCTFPERQKPNFTPSESGWVEIGDLGHTFSDRESGK